MLTQIYVKNFVLIDQVRLEFDKGLSVFTGETGAGKSLLIDAIGLLCGARASAGYVKKGASKAVIEGIFDISDKHPAVKLLSEQGIDLEGEDLIVSREITAEGKSSIRVCQRAVTASFLKELMAGIVDIHSQHDNQYLLQSKYHLSLLDQFCGNEKLLKDVGDAYRAYQTVKKAIDDSLQETYNVDDLDDLTAALNEIDDAKLQANELEELEESIKTMNRYETIQKQAAAAVEYLDGDQAGSTFLYQAVHALESVADVEPLKKIHQSLTDIYYQLDDLVSSLRQALEHMDFDEEKINELQERIFLYHRLYRKYGGSYEAIIRYRDELEKKIDLILHREDFLERKYKELEEKKHHYDDLSKQLSKIRQKKAKALEAAVNEQLQDLMLKNSKFHIDFKTGPISSKGFDRIEFQVSMNLQDHFTPLQKTASGGELSRLMLGLKCIFARLQGITTVIFDEIDTGVSGAVALAIGRKMQLLSEDIQVFCVTHLAQVAAAADHHLLVSKRDDGALTTTSIQLLNDDQRVNELAQISSSSQSEASLQAARELLSVARR